MKVILRCKLMSCMKNLKKKKKNFKKYINKSVIFNNKMKK